MAIKRSDARSGAAGQTRRLPKRGVKVRARAIPADRVVGFTGMVTTTGKSGAVRLESAFFKGNPEFAQRAKVRVDVIGPGYALLSVDQPPPDAAWEDAFDPVVGAYLAFLERDMREHPERIRPLDLDLERVSALLADVEPMRDDERMPDDFEL